MNLEPQTQEAIRLKPNLSIGYRFIKRTFDIIASFLGLIILSPVFLITAIAIKIEDPKGTIFFNQPRFGIECNPFTMYKFRSMYSDAEEQLTKLTPEQQAEWNSSFKLDNDPRITKVGSFIRKTSIDELPQLLNIFLGQMSAVGPRPPALFEKDAYGEALETIMSVRPGLTGYWQAHGRSDVSFSDRIAMNLFYIENMSVPLDIKIMLKTIASITKGEGAK